MNDPDDPGFFVKSIFGAQTQRGLVEITLGREKHLVRPAKAREMATFMLEAATAAEGDEVLMKVLDRVGMSQQRAAQVLLAMRAERSIIEARARHEAREAVAFDQNDPDQPEA